MAEVVSSVQVIPVSKNLRKNGQTIVLAGGCFDIIHPGHVIFLEKAKKSGDCLIVLLESDEKVKLLKGKNRPVFTQTDRAKVLSAMQSVDYVVMLPFIKFDSQYDELIAKIKPDVIVATSKDTNTHHRRSARLAGAKFKLIPKTGNDYSTSKILYNI